jgi:hypothetical protein
MGEKITPSKTLDTNFVRTVRFVSAHSKHEREEETVSEGEHSTWSKDEYDHIKQNISGTVYTELEKYPLRFIGNVQLVAEVERGFSFGAIFSSILGSQITGGSSKIGVYYDQSFYITGTIYELERKNLQVEE